MIDGVWLRGARCRDGARSTAIARVICWDRSSTAVSPPCRLPRRPRREIIPCNPATGEALARIAVTDTPALDAAIARAPRRTAGMGGAGAARPRPHPAPVPPTFYARRNVELARIETLNTGKPVQETEAVDVLSGADCLEYYAGVAATVAGAASGSGCGSVRLYAARAAGRRRRHRRVELSVADRLLEGGAPRWRAAMR